MSSALRMRMRLVTDDGDAFESVGNRQTFSSRQRPENSPTFSRGFRHRIFGQLEAQST